MNGQVFIRTAPQRTNGRRRWFSLGMPQEIRERSGRLNRCRSSHVRRRPSAVLADKVCVTMSRSPSIRARILNVLVDEPMTTLQLAERAGLTARRRGEVVKLACDVLEDEGLIERVGDRGHPKWRRPTPSTAEMCMNTTCQPSSGWRAPGLDERLACELIQGLVKSAISRGVDPAARLQQFRTLQQATIAMSQDPTLARATEQLVHTIDRTLQELTQVKS